MKYFTATYKGTALITVLPEQVQYTLMTADAFLSEIVGMTTALVKTYEMIRGADTLFPSDRENVGKC